MAEAMRIEFPVFCSALSFFRYNRLMKQKHCILIVISMILTLAVISGCNLPSEADKMRGFLRQTQTSDALAWLVETAQAENPFVPEVQQGQTEEDAAGSMITRVEDPAAMNAEPTAEPTSTPDPNREPPALPAVYQTDLLNSLDTPHEYEEDACVAIKNRWGKGKATPGTVVMAIMYHGIVKGDTVQQDNAVTVDQHKQLIRNLHDQGFTAINTEQFIAFMEDNSWIPERSVLLIVDDRHTEQNYVEHFQEYYDEWGWPVINAWISAEGTSQALWDENAHAEETGLVDHQSHGVVHNINMGDDSSDEFLIGELKGSVDAIQEHFHKTPRAIIWPGGGFGARPIEIAKEYGYKVGFTTHPRGPVMYNWVPLCDVNDATRPYYKMDGNMDPLFVIPRYWDTDASQHVDTVRQIGKAAKEYYNSTRATELEYYDIVCKPVLGDL